MAWEDETNDWLIAARIPRGSNNQGNRSNKGTDRSKTARSKARALHRYKQRSYRSNLIVRCPPHISNESIRWAVGYRLCEGRPALWVQEWMQAAKARDLFRPRHTENPLVNPYPLNDQNGYTQQVWNDMLTPPKRIYKAHKKHPRKLFPHQWLNQDHPHQ
jgi:hypothetical protein